MASLILHELTGSPNNVKARIALGYKGLDYDRKEFQADSFPGDRSPIVDVSRQPRLPVLQHGETVIFDSGSILRYLEANFPDSPPIFSSDYTSFGEIEGWELFARTQLGEPLGMMFGQFFEPAPDAEVIAGANQMLNERTGALEEKLSQSSFLVGDHLTAADIVTAAPLYLADMTPAMASHPLAQFFQPNLRLGDGREATRAWLRATMAHDAILGQREMAVV